MSLPSLPQIRWKKWSTPVILLMRFREWCVVQFLSMRSRYAFLTSNCRASFLEVSTNYVVIAVLIWQYQIVVLISRKTDDNVVKESQGFPNIWGCAKHTGKNYGKQQCLERIMWDTILKTLNFSTVEIIAYFRAGVLLPPFLFGLVKVHMCLDLLNEQQDQLWMEIVVVTCRYCLEGASIVNFQSQRSSTMLKV